MFETLLFCLVIGLIAVPFVLIGEMLEERANRKYAIKHNIKY